jgi:hypothetical protein
MTNHSIKKGWETLVKPYPRARTHSSSISKGKRNKRFVKSTPAMLQAAIQKRQHLEALIENPEYLLSYGVQNCFPYKFNYPIPPKAAARQGAEGITYTRNCGNMHFCPVCASRVMASYREDALELMLDWKQRGGRFYFLTLTQRTSIDVPTGDLYRGLTDSWAAMKRSAAYKESNTNAGSPECVKVLEESLSSSGWNVHWHILWFMPNSTKDKAATDFLDRCISQWVKSANKHSALGAEGPSQQWERVSDSPTKFAQTMSRYLFKHGYFDNTETRETLLAQTVWSPFELLRVFLHTGEVSFGNAWLDFQRSCRGKHRVRFSKGLRERLEELNRDQVEGRARS